MLMERVVFVSIERGGRHRPRDPAVVGSWMNEYEAERLTADL